jgi:hypothetical protein
MRHLVIVESPSKCKTIEKYLGPEYRVIATCGHFRGLHKLEQINRQTLEIKFETTKPKIVKFLKEEVGIAASVYLATDDDREGEAIAWHICKVCKLPLTTPRIVFHEITKEAIQDAGIAYEDLPEQTPVEVRQDEEGNEVIITADVAAALVLLENPAELIGAIFDDPGQALLAIASIGADMLEEEREESEKIIVASVIAAQAAVNAASMAASVASSTTRTPSGGGHTTGGGASAGESKAVRRRKP